MIKRIVEIGSPARLSLSRKQLKVEVAVGIPVSRYPPHRSGLAR